jgi:hypothetical protein
MSRGRLIVSTSLLSRSFLSGRQTQLLKQFVSQALASYGLIINIRSTRMLNKILLSIFMMCATPAFGLMLNFDDVPDEGEYVQSGGVFVESGFTIVGAWYNTAGAIHLDDSGTSFEDKAVISGSKRFDALCLHILGIESSTWYEIEDPAIVDGPYPIVRVDYPNVLVRGIRDSSIVAEARFAADSDINYTLSPEFTRLDSLIVSTIAPNDPALAAYFSAFESNLEALYPGSTYRMDCAYPCRHFDFDAIEVHPTPIPGAFVLILSALIGGGITRRLMAKQRAA